MNRKFLVIGGLVSLLLLSGCSAQGGSSSSAPGGTSGGEFSEAQPGGVDSGAQAGSEPGTAAGSAESGLKDAGAVAPDSQIVTTGVISLLADHPSAVADKAVALVESLGGHVDGRTESGGRGSGGSSNNSSLAYPSDTPRATLVLRIPNDKVTSAIDDLKGLATVGSSSITATDVTTQVADVNARITALQTSVNRLLDLMSKATTTTDLIALESTLSERQADLDGLTAQRDALTDQVRYASITVTIDATSTAPPEVPADFWSGLSTGSAALVAALGGALVAFGVALPWLILLAVMAAIVLAVVRLATRRGRTAAASAAAPTTATPAETPAE